jgi:CBS domain-containing protein
MRVADIIRQKGVGAVTVAPTDSVARAVELLRDHGFGALVVSGDGQAIEGIVSERDIVRALGLRSDLLDLPVTEIMTARVVTCSPDDRVDQLMSTMTEHRIRHLPVEVDGAMVGLVSIGDIVKVRVSELEHEAQTLQDYIQHGR